jgi:hypothetical protein
MAERELATHESAVESSFEDPSGPVRAGPT